jgi:hypothetical protein
MNAKMVRALQQCPERKRLVREWTDCSNRLSKLEDEKLAAIRNANPDLISFEAKLRVAKAADVEACRAHHQHVNEHECV